MNNFVSTLLRRGVSFAVFCIYTNFSTFAQNPLAPAQGFNVMTFSGINLNQGDVDGGIATRDKLTMRGAFTVSTNSVGTFVAPGDANKTTLIAEDGVVYTSGSGVNVVSGGLVKISNFSSNSKWWPTNPTRITSSSASSENENPLIQMSVSQPEVSINQDVFNFAAAFADFKATSDAYENCSSNINLTPSGSYTFNLIDNKSNFFKIPASSLNNLSEIRFSTTPTASTPVIINVDLNGASSFTWSTNTNFSGIANSAGQFILFNFVNGATGATINIDGATIIGSIFAPYYNVAKNSSNNIEGQVICNHYLD